MKHIQEHTKHTLTKHWLFSKYIAKALQILQAAIPTYIQVA